MKIQDTLVELRKRSGFELVVLGEIFVEEARAIAAAEEVRQAAARVEVVGPPVVAEVVPYTPARSVSDDDPERLLTYREVARYLGCSVATVKRYVRLGRLTPKRLSSRLVRFRLSEVEAQLTGDRES
ncbi:MAG: helix-turn-helix domain-containing protein [Acidobacteria bacterium]|nr:helix-turn-helix domain-containing protein [Acidobacteriota bacterium]